MTIRIRTLDKENLGSIQKLWEGLNAHHLANSTYFKDFYSQYTFEKRAKQLIKREKLIAYVAESDGKKVGYCVATVDGGAGEIDSLFVDEAYRGKGVGKELTSLALKWLDKQNCETIRVSIAQGNENAFGFYRHFGFAERCTVLQKRGNA